MMRDDYNYRFKLTDYTQLDYKQRSNRLSNLGKKRKRYSGREP